MVEIMTIIADCSKAKTSSDNSDTFSGLIFSEANFGIRGLSLRSFKILSIVVFPSTQ